MDNTHNFKSIHGIKTILEMENKYSDVASMIVDKLSNASLLIDNEDGLQLMSSTNNSMNTSSIVDPVGPGCTTSLGYVAEVSKFKNVILTGDFWDMQGSSFHKLKDCVNFFPVRTKPREFLIHVHGFLSPVEFNLLTTKNNQENRDLTQEGDNIIRQYTEGENWFCTRLNLHMALDAYTREIGLYAKKLKSLVGWQTPKYSGIVYRGALHSPLELFMMIFKKKFFIPSFVSTSMSLNNIIFNPYKEDVEQNQSFQNVILEIDTRNFPNFSTIIKSHQSKYSNSEQENLLSCYNIYSWKGLRLIKHSILGVVPVVSLVIENHESERDIQTHRVNIERNEVDITWLTKKGETAKQRYMNSTRLMELLKIVLKSYEKHNPSLPLTWANTDFVTIHDPLTECGTRLDGKEFTELQIKQGIDK